jgi:hypothetical protein
LHLTQPVQLGNFLTSQLLLQLLLTAPIAVRRGAWAGVQQPLLLCAAGKICLSPLDCCLF